MMIALIDDGDANRGVAELLRGCQSTEPGSNDDDMMHPASLAHALSFDPFILGIQ
jgi:hypothetical protein